MQFWTQDGIFELISPDRKSSVSVVFDKAPRSWRIKSEEETFILLTGEKENVSSVQFSRTPEPAEQPYEGPALFEYSATDILCKSDASGVAGNEGDGPNDDQDGISTERPNVS